MRPQSSSRACFDKRIYAPRSLVEALRSLYKHSDEMRTAIRGARISKAFSERIMLTVTAVNRCRYCSYAHAKVAQKSGIGQEEVERLLGGDLGDIAAEEAPALFFAQHYAESGGHPDPDAWRRLIDTYGDETAHDIVVHIRMITMGNLSGNSLDAFLSRLRGCPAPESGLLRELAVLGILAFGTPILVMAIVLRRIVRVLTRRAAVGRTQ